MRNTFFPFFLILIGTALLYSQKRNEIGLVNGYDKLHFTSYRFTVSSFFLSKTLNTHILQKTGIYYKRTFLNKKKKQIVNAYFEGSYSWGKDKLAFFSMDPMDPFTINNNVRINKLESNLYLTKKVFYFLEAGSGLLWRELHFTRRTTNQIRVPLIIRLSVNKKRLVIGHSFLFIPEGGFKYGIGISYTSVTTLGILFN